VLFQVQQPVFGSRYALWDSASLVAPLAISAAGTQLDAIAVSTPKTCKADFSSAVFSLPPSPTSYLYRAEIFVWGDLAIVAGAGPVPDLRVGLVNASANLSGALGADSNGIGLRLNAPTGGGTVFKNGAAVTPAFFQNPSLFVPGSAVMLELMMTSTGISNLTFRTTDGRGVIVISLPSLPSGPLALAVSIQTDNSQSAPNTVHALLNSGQRKFERDVYNTASIGSGVFPWIAPRASLVGPFYFADAPYLSGAGESPPNTRFRDRLATGGSLQISRKLNFWMWGGDGVGVVGMSSNISLDNTDGLYDPLIVGDVRDTLVSTFSAANGVPLDVMTLNSAAPRDDSVVTLNLAGPAATFEMPAQSRIGLPNSAPALANKPYAIALGTLRNASPILRSGLQFIVGDVQYCGVSLARVKAYPLNPGATPADYVQDENGSLTTATTPLGALTVDIETFNCAAAAKGATATASSTATSNYPASAAINGDRTGAGWGAGTGGWSDGTAGVFPDWLQVNFNNAQLIDTVIVVTLQNGAAANVPTPTMTFTQYGLTAFEVQVEVWAGSGWVWQSVANITGNNLVMRTITFSARIARAVKVICNDSADLLTGNKQSRIVELEAWTTQLGRSLDSLGTEVFKRVPYYQRIGNPWNSADAQAIDSAAGYVGPIGFYADAAVKVRDIIAPAVDSFCACLWQSTSIHLTRLIAPETVAVGARAGTISDLDMVGDLVLTPDLAPGLTTQALGQRNWTPQTDYTTDTVVLTPAVRSMLASEYRITRSYSGQLAGMYEHARNASPIGTLLDDPSDLQRFIDYVCGLYKVPRLFATVQTRYISAVELGQVWTLKYHRYGLSSGVGAIVVGLQRDAITKTMVITFWFAGNAT
jgi:hypothetical protein